MKTSRFELPEGRIKRNADYEKSVGGKTIILKGGKLYLLNEEASIIWKYLGKLKVERICDEISKATGQPKRKVRRQVLKFLKKLIDLNMITVKRR